MTDEEYIRKGVGIAGGSWRLRDDGAISTPWASWHPDIHKREWRQWQLDALAAQLVRQVDALPQWCVQTYIGVTQLIEDIGHQETEIQAWASGPDRTMNTIKAIVDSGVLTTGNSDGDRHAP